MEAIKCPNCGSEKVQKRTEEEYVCLACDNIFPVHNLSKEFRKTDEHISDVHQDINKNIDKNFDKVIDKIDKLDENLESGASNLKFQYENAYHLIEIGEYERAERVFDTLCEQHSMNYQSWYGKVLIATDNLADTQSWDVLLGDVFWGLVEKMRKCEDYPQEVEERMNEFFDRWTATENFDYVKEQIEDFRTEMLGLPMKAIKLTRWILLAIAEWLAFGWFFATIMKSVNVITTPLPDPSSKEAGTKLGSAITNFFAIPVKGVIGIAVMCAIYIGIKYLYKLVTEEYWYEIEEVLARRNADYHGALERAGEWFGTGKSSQELLEMLEKEINKHILFAEKVEQQIVP